MKYNRSFWCGFILYWICMGIVVGAVALLIYAVEARGQSNQWVLNWRQSILDQPSRWELWKVQPIPPDSEVFEVPITRATPEASDDPGAFQYRNPIPFGLLNGGEEVYLKACNVGGCSHPSNRKVLPTMTPTGTATQGQPPTPTPTRPSSLPSPLPPQLL